MARYNVQALYTDHHLWLVRWLKRRMYNSDKALDIAQDAFVRILSQQKPLDQLQEPRAWLASIAKGLLIDKARREALEQAYLDTLQQLPETESISAEDQWLLLELLEKVDALLHELKPKVRTAFLLSRLEGLSYAEIAQQLGVSRPSVEKYIATAMLHCYNQRYSDENC